MNETIIVTGAAGNLGKAVTQRLLADDYRIHATLGPKDDPQFIAHEQLSAQTVNLLSDEATEAYVAELVPKIEAGELKALICLVGAYTQADLKAAEANSVRKMMQLNFESAYFLTHHLVKACKDLKSPLQVIFIGGRPAIEPQEGNMHIAYGLSKSLLFKLAEFINVETNHTGISASVIVPSTLDTPGTRAAMPEADPSNWVPTERVAETISFILSDAGRMMRQPVYKLYNQA